MAALIKLLLLSLVISVFLALQYAVPTHSGNEEAQVATTATTQKTLDPNAESVELESEHVSDFSKITRGSFAVANPSGGYDLSPLVSTTVDMTVTGMVARTKVRQTFVNQSEDWVNGIYLFPLPEQAAVDNLEMIIGERRIVGEIHPKKKAKQIFEKAKKAGKSASLLVQQRPNLFTNRVANIAPGESIQVEIHYQQTVRYDQGEFSLRFPTTYTPRYKPGDSLPSEFSSTGWSFAAQNDDAMVWQENEPMSATGQHGNLRISVLINAGFEIEQIDSPYHEVSQQALPQNQYRILLSGNQKANRDFNLVWRPRLGSEPQTALFTQTVDGEEFGLIMIMPPHKRENAASDLNREVIFVIDTSGSMAGTSMQQAKMALNLAIGQLSEQDRFNLIEFDSTSKALWSFSKPANQHNKAEAQTVVSALQADGGTEILPALKLALGGQSNTQTEYVRQVIFLTDGSVGNEAALMQYIQQNLGQSRLFTVGIGSAPNSYFMSEAATTGRGTYTYVGDVSEVGGKMGKLFNKLKQPALTELGISFDEKVEYYPRNLPDLYFGEPLVISYKGEKSNKTLTFSARDNANSLKLSIPEQGGMLERGVDKLWARNKIGQLTRDRRLQGNVDMINRQIEQTALKHHLVSEFTSLVAVDVTPSRPQEADSKDKAVRNLLPKGSMMPGSMPKTATGVWMQLVIGLFSLMGGLCAIFLPTRKIIAH